MQRSIFRIIFVVQSILAPIIRVLGFLNSRREFENQNLTDELCSPWSEAESKNAFIWAFHCSSEGEFEQLKPLMQQTITNKDKIELIFTSPSVLKKVRAFASENRDCVRILRLPLLRPGELSKWSKAKTLIMCRYDFFPELLLLPVGKRILTWASLKGKKQSLWLKAIYAQFDLVIASTNHQYKEIKNILAKDDHTNLEVYDFRPLQIRRRLQGKSLSTSLIELVQQKSSQQRLILGSVWQHDLHLLRNLLKSDESIHLWLAPHDLSAYSLESFRSFFLENYSEFEIVSVNLKSLEDELKSLKNIALGSRKVIWMLESPGILVELYSQFEYAYVGGGFGRSIHSVLEPTIAGCKVSCGPKTHRSTEIDLAKELSPKQLKVVTTASDFDLWWSNAHQQPLPLEDDKVSQAIENWIKKSDEIIGRTLAH